MSLLRPLLRAPSAGLMGRLAPVRTVMEFSEIDRKGGYSQKPTKEQVKEMRREYLKVIPGEIKRFRIFWSERTNRRMKYKHGTYKPFEDFSRTPDYVKPEWVVTVDADHSEGLSKAHFERTKKGIGIFSGTLCTDIPKSGEQTRAGYVSIRSPMNMVCGFNVGHDIQNFNCVVVHYRGDGRNYTINMHAMGSFDIEWHDVFSYNLYTRGGPYWQTAKIPFSKFIFNFKGRIQDVQYRLGKSIKCMNISLIDSRPGPFKLELKKIGFYYDNTLTERNAYEMYATSSTSKVYK